MNKLQEWHRKMELKHKRKFTAEELAGEQYLDISISYYAKISAGIVPLTKKISDKMKKVLAIEV